MGVVRINLFTYGFCSKKSYSEAMDSSSSLDRALSSSVSCKLILLLIQTFSNSCIFAYASSYDISASVIDINRINYCITAWSGLI